MAIENTVNFLSIFDTLSSIVKSVFDCCLSGVLLITDVDECSTNSGRCEYKCINLHGGYRCDCPRGKTLHADGRTCIGK